MGPCMFPRIFCTARNSRIRTLTLSNPRWSSSRTERAWARSKQSSELVCHGSTDNSSRYEWVIVYSGCCGWMPFSRRSSFLATRSASGGRPALAILSLRRFTSSSSSSPSLFPKSSSAPSLLGSPASRCTLTRTRRRSFCTSWICRCSTTLFSSCSRVFWIPALISPEILLASDSRWTSSSTYSRRSLTPRRSRMRCRSATGTCPSVAPATPTRPAAEEGRRSWRARPPSGPLFSSSLSLSCMLRMSASTDTSCAWASRSSSTSRTVATSSGDVCSKRSTVNRDLPSTTSLHIDFSTACWTSLQSVPVSKRSPWGSGAPWPPSAPPLRPLVAGRAASTPTAPPPVRSRWAESSSKRSLVTSTVARTPGKTT
mmetsp:Transcript_78261/g.221895  ORF Transcript_78261/g.221895 Transcript_78261/m.221895 type:complete len:371 (+) Transcript_78261:845-1957(+)